jgi:hypothetical protein
MKTSSDHVLIKEKVKWSRYRPGVAQRVGRGIALLFHDHGTRRGWVVSSTPRPHFTPGKDQVPILQETGWAPGPAWTGGKSPSRRDSIPDRPARSSVAIPTELPGPLICNITTVNSHISAFYNISLRSGMSKPAMLPDQQSSWPQISSGWQWKRRCRRHQTASFFSVNSSIAAVRVLAT